MSNRHSRTYSRDDGFFGRALLSCLAGAVTWVAAIVVTATTAAANDRSAIAAMYQKKEIFLEAISRETIEISTSLQVTGITVPHHLLAADLMARGFWAAAGGQYDRVILLSPDHFNRNKRPLATTRRAFATVFGVLENDHEATSALLQTADLFEESDLFEQEHGVAALVPFIKHFFPGAKLVPITASNNSTRAHWERGVAAIAPLLGPRVLVIQSTDYSHYLPLSTAIHRDQETLNVLSAADPGAIERLVQVAHMDSKAAQYIQMRLQSDLLGSNGIVIGSRNSAAYGASAFSTTSYIVSVYTSAPEAGARLRYDDQQVIYFAGDTFLGRLMNAPFSKAEVADAVVAEVHKLTGGAPLIVNLEGAVLHEPPEKLPDNALVAHAALAVPILKALNVQAAGLANNHSHDLGPLAYRETQAVLAQAGIRPMPHNSVLDLGAFRITALNFVLGSHPDHPLVTPDALAALCQLDARPPLIAFVHWGEEYNATAGPAEYSAAAAMQSCGVSAVVGAHSHRASLRVEALQGGEYLMVYSLGNFLFDQRSPRSSGALLELRVFEQSTYSARLVPLRNLYEFALALSRERNELLSRGVVQEPDRP